MPNENRTVHLLTLEPPGYGEVRIETYGENDYGQSSVAHVTFNLYDLRNPPTIKPGDTVNLVLNEQIHSITVTRIEVVSTPISGSRYRDRYGNMITEQVGSIDRHMEITGLLDHIRPMENPDPNLEVEDAEDYWDKIYEKEMEEEENLHYPVFDEKFEELWKELMGEIKEEKSKKKSLYTRKLRIRR